MIRRYSRAISLILIITLLFSIAFPGEASAGISLKKFARWAGHQAGHVLALPEKVSRTVTKPLGKTLGPIAAHFLTAGITGNAEIANLFKQARKIKNIADDIKFVDDCRDKLRKFYKDEAKRYRQEADNLSDRRTALSSQLGKEPQKLSDYIAIPAQIEANKKMAQILDDRSKHIRSGDVMKMLGNKALARVSKDFERIIQQEFYKELGKLINPRTAEIIANGGIDPNAVIEAFVTGDVNRILRAEGYEGHPDFNDMKNRIVAQIKEKFKEDRDYYRKNWKTEVAKLVDAEIEAAKKKPAEETEAKDEETIASENAEPEAEESDEPPAQGESDNAAPQEDKYPFADTQASLRFKYSEQNSDTHDFALGHENATIALTKGGSISASVSMGYSMTAKPKQDSGKVGYDPIEGLQGGQTSYKVEITADFNKMNIIKQTAASLEFELTGPYKYTVTEDGGNPEVSNGTASLKGRLDNNFNGSGTMTTKASMPWVTE